MTVLRQLKSAFAEKLSRRFRDDLRKDKFLEIWVIEIIITFMLPKYSSTRLFFLSLLGDYFGKESKNGKYLLARIESYHHFRKLDHRRSDLAEKKLSFFLKYRYFEEVEDLERQGVVLSKDQKYYFESVKSKITELGPLPSLASRNERVPRESQLVYYRGNAVKLSELPEGTPVAQYFIPGCYYHRDDTDFGKVREKVWFRVRTVFMNLFHILSNQKIAIWPRHHFFLFKLLPDTQFPSFSYHTFSKHSRLMWNVKESALLDYFLVDRGGYSGWSSLSLNSQKIDTVAPCVDSQEANKTWQALFDSTVASGVTKYVQTSMEDSSQLPPKFIFCALQVQSDMVAQHRHMGTVELISSLVVYAEKNNLALVIKRHPLCESKKIAKLLKKYTSHPLVSVSGLPIHTLIKLSSVVVTVNSGVGFESLIHLKPVILVGAADYQWSCKVAYNKEDLNVHLTHIFKNGIRAEDIENIKKFLYLYLVEYAIKYDDTERLEARVLSIFSKKTSKRDQTWLSLNDQMNPEQIATVL